MRSKVATATLTMLALGVTAACGGGGGSGDSDEATTATGPIKVWLSNNPEEIAWGEQMVEAWNAEHPDEEVTAQEIPAGKTSEEVIGAAITAGNAPCLVFNTSPAAVPQFEKQGGLVALDSFEGGAEYVESRSGDVAEQYQSPDGQYFQMPWKSNGCGSSGGTSGGSGHGAVEVAGLVDSAAFLGEVPGPVRLEVAVAV